MNREGPKIVADSRFVSDGYFAALRIPILAGEGCQRTNKQFSAVVNHSFATAYLSNPVGEQLKFTSGDFQQPSAKIVGLAGDAREQGLDHAPAPTIYWCGSAPFPSPYFLVRTQGTPLAMADTLRQKIRKLEPFRSVFSISALDEHLTNNFAQNRLRTALLTAFALTAILLACTGLYGTVNYFVEVRRKETGLRLALGATQGQIVGTFLGKGVMAAVLGCAVGLGLAAGCSRLLAGMLFGVQTTDSMTLAGVITLVLAVATLATLVPALRASGVEPMRVLREE